MEKVERAFQNVVDDKNYEIKASSIMPKFTSKLIKIDTKIVTITVSPQDLKYVKQAMYFNLPSIRRRCSVRNFHADRVFGIHSLLN